MDLVLALTFLTGIGAIRFPPCGGLAFALKDLSKHLSCPYCGMNRQKFAHSRLYGEFDNGSTLGICSIQCAAADMAIHINKAPVKIWLGGSNTKHLIDAETPDWIIGRK